MTRQYLYTEQAHLMCPNMNFGIVCEVNSPFDENRIRETLSRVFDTCFLSTFSLSPLL